MFKISTAFLTVCFSHLPRPLLVWCLVLMASLGCSYKVHAQQNITSSTAHTTDFNSMGSTAGATIPFPWNFYLSGFPTWSSAATYTTYAAGTSGANAITSSSPAGLYNMGNDPTASATDRALVWLGPSNNVNYIGAYTNRTGLNATKVYLSVDFKKFRTGTDAYNWYLYVGDSPSSITALVGEGSGGYAADANSTTIYEPARIRPFTVLIDRAVANNATIYLRFVFDAGTSAATSQVIGFDNIEASFNISAPPFTSPTTATTTSNEVFTYTPTSSFDPLVSYAYLRPDVSGITNAGIYQPTSISGSFNEVLINTTNADIVVPYTIISTHTITKLRTVTIVNVTVKPQFRLSPSPDGFNYGDVAWGDYDNDGDLDFVGVGTNASGVRSFGLYRKISGSFVLQTITGSVGVSNGTVNWVDYDRDGDLDIHFTGFAGGTTYINRILINNGNATFSVGPEFTGVNWGAVAWGDYDRVLDQGVIVNMVIPKNLSPQFKRIF